MDNSIQTVVDDVLCAGCGACAGVCPQNAIHLKRNPAGFLYANLYKHTCIQCGKCLKVCPSTNKNALCVYKIPLLSVSGHAKDEHVWGIGQSGGVVTALLLYLIKTGIVDGAVVTRLNNGKPETIYTEDPTIVQSCAGSVYAQTSVAETVLKVHNKRMAIVALGCQTKAIRKAIEHGRKDLESSFIIGLICGGNMSLDMKDELMRQLKVKVKGDGEFRYRDKEHTGWPGAPTYNAGTDIKKLTYEARTRLKPAYECYRCVVCPDKMNLDCDIVVGDPWGIEEDETPQGMSVALAYTEKGKQLLKEAEEVILWREIDPERVLKGQRIRSDYYERLQMIASNKNGFTFPFEPLKSDVILKALLKRLTFDKEIYCEIDQRKLIRKRKALTKDTNVIKELLYKMWQKWSCNKDA